MVHVTKWYIKKGNCYKTVHYITVLVTKQYIILQLCYKTVHYIVMQLQSTQPVDQWALCPNIT
jgi:hypothetical protein